MKKLALLSLITLALIFILALPAGAAPIAAGIDGLMVYGEFGGYGLWLGAEYPLSDQWTLGGGLSLISGFGANVNTAYAISDALVIQGQSWLVEGFSMSEAKALYRLTLGDRLQAYLGGGLLVGKKAIVILETDLDWHIAREMSLYGSLMAPVTFTAAVFNLGLGYTF